MKPRPIKVLGIVYRKVESPRLMGNIKEDLESVEAVSLVFTSWALFITFEKEIQLPSAGTDLQLSDLLPHKTK